MHKLEFNYAPEVREALATGRPVVALESTIISHGMPYPQNVKTAREVEDVIRSHGVTPATIGILEGVVCIGMTPEELETFGRLGPKCHKVSRRDLAFVLAARANGATTVAGTMLLAHLAGIRVFVTGGIGGVHRGAEESWDVSADLTELGKTPVAVVCAGAKSILDIPKTLEYLETQGVPVVGFGLSTSRLFFTPSSGLKASCSVASSADAARLCSEHFRLGLSTGVVLANPIPADFAAEAEKVEAATLQAVQELSTKKLEGREVTPFLLARIEQLTKGESLKANIALVKNNARVGAEVAAELYRLERTGAVVVGGMAIDIISKPDDPGCLGATATSVIGVTRKTYGGVGRNISECMARLGARVQLISAVGGDSLGDELLEASSSIGIDVSGVTQVADARTGTFSGLLDGRGDLVGAVVDMGVYSAINDNAGSTLPPALRSSSLLILDANMDPSVISQALKQGEAAAVPSWFETVSVPKAQRSVGALQGIELVKPNLAELKAICEVVAGPQPPPGSKASPFDEARRYGGVTLEKLGVKRLLVSCGRHGAVLLAASSCPVSAQSRTVTLPLEGLPPLQLAVHQQSAHCVEYQLLAPVDSPVSTTGAGDCLMGGTAAAYLKGMPIETAVVYGMLCAHAALFADTAVSPMLSPAVLRVKPSPVAKL